MTLERFAMLVRQMRKHQTDYFRTRSAAALAASKAAERMVDRAAQEIIDAVPLRLFDPDGSNADGEYSSATVKPTQR